MVRVWSYMSTLPLRAGVRNNRKKTKRPWFPLLSLTGRIPLSHSSDQKERAALGAFSLLNRLWAAVRPGAVGKEKNGKLTTIQSWRFWPPSPVFLLAVSYFLDFSNSCTMCSYLAHRSMWWERPSQVCFFPSCVEPSPHSNSGRMVLLGA